MKVENSAIVVVRNDSQRQYGFIKKFRSNDNNAIGEESAFILQSH